jgi:GNAT superfamily N-acetyltransferase
VSHETPKTEVRVLSLEEILPLRHAILRAGRPLETARYANDNDPGVCHLGAFRDGELLAVGSLYIAEMPGRPGIAAVQVRGVATRPEARGTGLGTALMVTARDFAQKQGARILWCNARVSAAEFYRKLGFEIVSGEFEIPNIGPHYLMMVKLPASAGPAPKN